jgi:hypothetical protein
MKKECWIKFCTEIIFLKSLQSILLQFYKYANSIFFPVLWQLFLITNRMYKFVDFWTVLHLLSETAQLKFDKDMVIYAF